MSVTSYDTETTPRSRPAQRPPLKPKRGRWLWLSAAAVGVVLVAAVLVYLLTGSSAGESQILTYTVKPVPLDVKLKLTGDLNAIRNVEIKNKVEGQTTILWIIDEGTQVKQGDLLVRLASDQIETKLEDAKIQVENARATTVNAAESLKIQENQNESDINAARIAAELAKLSYEQFDKGDAPTQLDTDQTALKNAETTLERKTDDLARVQELSKQGFVSNNDVLDALVAYRDAQNQLRTAKMTLQTWNKYAEPKQRQTLIQQRDEALRELERTQAKAQANLLLKEAAYRAAQLTQRVQEARLKDLEDQEAACEIRAPQPGMVVYESSVQHGWNVTQIEEGATVRQRQTLIQLPDTSQYEVETKIAEQLVDRVQPGLPAIVTVGAIPGVALQGHVAKISTMPDNSNRWLNPNLKEYITEVVLDSTLKSLKPGMSAKAEIEVVNLDHALAVPLQCVFTGSGQSYVFLEKGQGYEKRTVKLGLSSNDMVEVKEGLKMGDVVLLSRPKDAPADDTSMADKVKKGGPQEHSAKKGQQESSSQQHGADAGKAGA